jgi:hypothetical protein
LPLGIYLYLILDFLDFLVIVLFPLINSSNLNPYLPQSLGLKDFNTFFDEELHVTIFYQFLETTEEKEKLKSKD